MKLIRSLVCLSLFTTLAISAYAQNSSDAPSVSNEKFSLLRAQNARQTDYIRVVSPEHSKSLGSVSGTIPTYRQEDLAKAEQKHIILDKKRFDAMVIVLSHGGKLQGGMPIQIQTRDGQGGVIMEHAMLLKTQPTQSQPHAITFTAPNKPMVVGLQKDFPGLVFIDDSRNPYQGKITLITSAQAAQAAKAEAVENLAYQQAKDDGKILPG